MQNQFKPIVDYRLVKVNAKERVIMRLQGHINRIVNSINGMTEQINHIHIPDCGSFNQVVQVNFIVQSLRKKIEWKRIEKAEYEQQLLVEQDALKQLQIEYEKAKHLYDLQEQKRLAHIEDMEQNEQDEIVQALYHN